MTALPDMVNWLSKKIIYNSKNKVIPVVYTRHPNAIKLDTAAVVVNFTIESKNDLRKKYAPTGSRLVMSSWGGEVIKEVAINFIEHHGDKHFIKIGEGNVCPVTAANENFLTCDAARCTKCFDKV
jgi:deoxyribodipyrimidine photolyase